jgi:hypothetical protein
MYQHVSVRNNQPEEPASTFVVADLAKAAAGSLGTVVSQNKHKRKAKLDKLSPGRLELFEIKPGVSLRVGEHVFIRHLVPPTGSTNASFR